MDKAVTIIGRIACPLCPHQAAHVKRRGDKLPYLHCPECGCLLTTRNGMQAAHLMNKARPDKLAALSRPAPAGQAADMTATTAAPAEPHRWPPMPPDLLANETGSATEPARRPAPCDPLAAMVEQLGGLGASAPSRGRRPEPSTIKTASGSDAGGAR
jgi:hypothetical protein